MIKSENPLPVIPVSNECYQETPCQAYKQAFVLTQTMCKNVFYST